MTFLKILIACWFWYCLYINLIWNKKKYSYFKIPENLEKYLNTYILKAFSINLKSVLDNNQNPVFCGPLSEKLSYDTLKACSKGYHKLSVLYTVNCIFYTFDFRVYFFAFPNWKLSRQKLFKIYQIEGIWLKIISVNKYSIIFLH